MNVLLISSLYPSFEDSQIKSGTRALHNLVKIMNRYPNGKVVVVCPVFIYLRELITGKTRETFKKSLTPKHLRLDDVPVIVYPVFKIPRLAYFYYPLYRYLNKYLRIQGFAPEVIAAHYDKSLQIGYRCARKKGLPLAVGLHITPDLLEDEPTAFTRRCGKILAAAAVVACRSGYIYNKIVKWFPQFQDKCFIAFSGIEAELIQEPAAAVRRLKQWKSSGKLSIITVSSLIERKKIDTILRTLALLKDSFDWTYTIIGSGEELDRLQALAVQLGIRERVHFKGALPRHEAIQEMRQSHLFILVSVLETFGLAYLEAMASGNIVIGACGEGIDGVIVHEKNGFLSPAGEVEPLKQLLEHIVLQLSEGKLAGILADSYQTITQFTDENAAQNYWKNLEEIFFRWSHKGTQSDTKKEFKSTPPSR